MSEKQIRCPDHSYSPILSTIPRYFPLTLFKEKKLGGIGELTKDKEYSREVVCLSWPRIRTQY